MASTFPAHRPAPRLAEGVVAIVAIVVAGLVVVPLVLTIAEPSPSGFTSSPAAYLAFASHIDHIVFLVMENHAFDNYFGAYCPAAGPYCGGPNDGIPPGTCVPFNASSPNAGCIRPFPFSPKNWSISDQLPHSYASSTRSWNQGAMNGFYQAEHSNLTPFGYYTATTAPLYWDLAQEYGLGDYFFSSILAYSLPNHWHIVAGTAPAQIIKNGTQWLGSAATTIAGDHKYLDEANVTPDIADELATSSVSWKYYDYPLASYTNATAITIGPQGGIGSLGGAYDYWNPLAGKAESYNATFDPHFVSNVNFFTDAHLGNLPNLAWVIPPGQDSDHPPNNSTAAQSYVASVVDAVESSPEWSTTALFITWDDYGGFYDHVPPPQTSTGAQLGFRVPLLVVSPYTPPGRIDSEYGYFESILHLMEWRFGLPCLTGLDCSAPLPLGFFDFHAGARAPTLFPTNFSAMRYPFAGPALAGADALAAYRAPSNFTVFADGEAPDVD